MEAFLWMEVVLMKAASLDAASMEVESSMPISSLMELEPPTWPTVVVSIKAASLDVALMEVEFLVEAALLMEVKAGVAGGDKAAFVLTVEVQ